MLIKPFLLPLSASLLIIGCSVNDYRNVINVARSGNVESLKNIAIDKSIRYATNPSVLQKDIASIQGDFLKILKVFLGDVVKEWGNKEAKEATQKKYVKYTNNYKTRAIVDFENGVVTVETLVDQNIDEELKKALITTMLTPEDPNKVDLYSSKDIELKGEPYLAGLIKDHQDKVVLYDWRARQYANYLIATAKNSRVSEGKKVTFVTFNLVKDYEAKSSNKYQNIVKLYSKKYGLEESLVMAIIKTESNFNPYAVSHAPAYGLMQIVPATAGRDVYNELEGRDGIPTKEVLFDPKSNIKYGTTYLNILYQKYLDGIHKRDAQEYCVISAYNTGSGNVLRVFDDDKSKALSRINLMSPENVYEKLKTSLPYTETRRYLDKVLIAKRGFDR